MAMAVRALGEVALRVNDLDKSQAFYADVISLELMRRFEHAVFFRIADGYAGHTAVLALFDRKTPVERHPYVRVDLAHSVSFVFVLLADATRIRIEGRPR
jgi:catechol-2,3-dioxygenase